MTEVCTIIKGAIHNSTIVVTNNKQRTTHLCGLVQLLQWKTSNQNVVGWAGGGGGGGIICNSCFSVEH